MKGSNKFWRMVDKEGECWNWRGPTSGGKPLQFFASNMSVQRFALRDKGRRVRKLHPADRIEMVCENPLCVRPGHMKVVRAELRPGGKSIEEWAVIRYIREVYGE